MSDERVVVASTATLGEAISRAGSEELTDLVLKSLSQAVYQDEAGRSELRAVLTDWNGVSADFSISTNATPLHGFCRYLLGDLESARELLSADLKNPWSAYFLIRVLMGLQRFEDALNTVEASYKTHSDFTPLAFMAVEVYCRNGWEDQVPDILKAVESTFGDTADFAFYSGFYHERLSAYRTAIEYYRKAVEIDPDYTNAHFRLGFCLDLSGRGDEETLDEAIAAYEQCLKAVPPHTNAVINLGTLYEDRERYHDAIKCYESVLRCNPNHERARLFLEDARAATRMFYDREEEKKADRQSQVLKIPVTDFELSVRSRNCLQKMNILTLGDLMLKTEQELLSYKNFGETSLNEIKELLHSKSLVLGQGREHPGTEGSQPRNPLEATADPGLLDQSIDELDLSVRSRRCMERLGVTTLRELINHTEVQLMAAKNFGMTSLNEIKRKLSEHGLQLRI